MTAELIIGLLFALNTYLLLSNSSLHREARDLRKDLSDLRTRENENSIFDCDSRMRLLDLVAQLARCVGVDVPDLKTELARLKEHVPPKEEQH